MKGIVYTKFGSPDVLKLMDVEKPTPKAHQVLIKVKASTISILEYLRFTEQVNNGKIPFYIYLMDTLAFQAIGKIPGTDVSGVVEEVGKKVKRFKKGDNVFGITGLRGGWAEYALANENSISKKPENLSFEQSAVIPTSGITALGAVNKAKIKEGQQVLVYGASGGVGQFAVQLSKALGATVTGVCSTRNIEMAQSIGADYVIDYKKEDFTQNGKTYDAIIAVNGYNPLSIYKKALNKGGSYIVVGATKQAAMGLLGSPFFIGSGKKTAAVAYPFLPKQQLLSDLKEIAEKGKLTPFIDKVYSAQEAPEAIRYIIKEHAQGKVVLKMDFNDNS